MLETYNIQVDGTDYEVDVLVDLEPGDPWRYEVIEKLKIKAKGPYFHYEWEINLDHFLVGQPIHRAIEEEHARLVDLVEERRAEVRHDEKESWERCRGI